MENIFHPSLAKFLLLGVIPDATDILGPEKWFIHFNVLSEAQKEGGKNEEKISGVHRA